MHIFLTEKNNKKMAYLWEKTLDLHVITCYNIIKGKEVKQVESTIKKLLKLVEQLEKLVIRIISLIGWIFILIKLFQ